LNKKRYREEKEAKEKEEFQVMDKKSLMELQQLKKGK
jgi:hypothetical protein